jgi:prolyl 4-hydroxylase
LYYLEAPEKGGATVFPSIKVAVQPKRRAAIFWYNLHTSGDGDYDTRHAACKFQTPVITHSSPLGFQIRLFKGPVLFGTKWVSNRWIHAVGQEFIRPCRLTREYSDEMHL